MRVMPDRPIGSAGTSSSVGPRSNDRSSNRFASATKASNCSAPIRSRTCSVASPLRSHDSQYALDSERMSHTATDRRMAGKGGMATTNRFNVASSSSSMMTTRLTRTAKSVNSSVYPTARCATFRCSSLTMRSTLSESPRARRSLRSSKVLTVRNCLVGAT